MQDWIHERYDPLDISLWTFSVKYSIHEKLESWYIHRYTRDYSLLDVGMILIH